MAFDIDDEFYQSFLMAMQKHQVRYMLIGGIAINFHGVIRNTQDMDIWLAPTNQNRNLFCNVLIDLGYTQEELTDENTFIDTFFDKLLHSFAGSNQNKPAAKARIGQYLCARPEVPCADLCKAG
jgi:hypothetical protein